jgi:hypothetical protein
MLPILNEDTELMAALFIHIDFVANSSDHKAQKPLQVTVPVIYGVGGKLSIKVSSLVETLP